MITRCLACNGKAKGISLAAGLWASNYADMTRDKAELDDWATLCANLVHEMSVLQADLFDALFKADMVPTQLLGEVSLDTCQVIVEALIKMAGEIAKDSGQYVASEQRLAGILVEARRLQVLFKEQWPIADVATIQKARLDIVVGKSAAAASLFFPGHD